MTLDEILFEWSYRCPKGYPTIVDGKFVDRDEVITLNELLSANGFNVIKLPEATPKKVSTTLSDTEVDKILNNKEVRTLSVAKRKVMSTKGTNVIVLYVTNISKNQRAEKLQSIAQSIGGTYTKAVSSAGAVKGSYSGKPFFIALKVEKEEKTDTDLKEGMSVVMSNVLDVQSASADNVVQVINKMLAALPKTEGLSAVTVDKINKYLLSMKAKAKQDSKSAKIIASILNENISHGNSFKVFLDKNPDFRLERGQEKSELFTEIRNAGAQITNLPADKWCPGDVYFIRRGSEDVIRGILKDALSTDNKEAALTKLNSMFSTIGRFDEKVSNKHDIVAVSLKQSSAQGGKLKSAFQQYEGTKTEYNITPEEMKFSVDILKKSIESMRKQLKSFISAEKVTNYLYDPVNLAKVNNPKILRGKFGAYKAMMYIMKYIAKKGDSLDDAMVGLTAYGFGIVQKNNIPINPPFLKLIADANGAVTVPQFFKPGRTLALMKLDGGKRPPEIQIVDSEEYGGIKVYMTLQLLGDVTEKIKYEVNYRYNGGDQLTIELGKPVHIG